MVALGLAVLATVEWLRRPAWPWAVAAIVLATAAVAVLRPLEGWRRRALAGALIGLTAALAIAHYRLARIDNAWPAEREARVEAAADVLDAELRAARRRAVDAAVVASRLDADADRRTAFTTLAAAVPRDGAEIGIVVLDSAGRPWAWAGRHRLAPAAEGDSLAVRATGYYLVLETRRHSAGGRSAVASVLIRADSSVPDRAGSLAERFRERTGVGLAVYPAGAAPDGPDVFSYPERSAAGDGPLFSVRPVPPDQGAAKEAMLALARMRDPPGVVENDAINQLGGPKARAH